MELDTRANIPIIFRMKGKQEETSLHPSNIHPSIALPQAGEPQAIDLSAYKVIFLTGGRGVWARMEAMIAQAPDAIIIALRQGALGSEIVAHWPAHFDGSRVRYALSSKQRAAAEQAERLARVRALAEAVMTRFPQVYAAPDAERQAVALSPADFSIYRPHWQIKLWATSVEEAQSLIAQHAPFWQEWRERIASVYRERGWPLRRGLTLILKTAEPPRCPSERAGISFSEKDEQGRPIQGYVVLEKREGAWVIARDLTGRAAEYIGNI